jgi:hypothetical protein
MRARRSAAEGERERAIRDLEGRTMQDGDHDEDHADEDLNMKTPTG